MVPAFPPAPKRSGSAFGELDKCRGHLAGPRVGALCAQQDRGGGAFLVGLCYWQDCAGWCPSLTWGGPLALRAPAPLPEGILGHGSSRPLMGWCRPAWWPRPGSGEAHSALIFQEASPPYLGPLGSGWALGAAGFSFPPLQ